MTERPGSSRIPELAGILSNLPPTENRVAMSDTQPPPRSVDSEMIARLVRRAETAGDVADSVRDALVEVATDLAGDLQDLQNNQSAMVVDGNRNFSALDNRISELSRRIADLDRKDKEREEQLEATMDSDDLAAVRQEIKAVSDKQAELVAVQQQVTAISDKQTANEAMIADLSNKQVALVETFTEENEGIYARVTKIEEVVPQIPTLEGVQILLDNDFVRRLEVLNAAMTRTAQAAIAPAEQRLQIEANKVTERLQIAEKQAAAAGSKNLAMETALGEYKEETDRRVARIQNDIDLQNRYMAALLQRLSASGGVSSFVEGGGERPSISDAPGRENRVVRAKRSLPPDSQVVQFTANNNFT